MDLISKIILVDNILYTFPFYEKNKWTYYIFDTSISQMKKILKKNCVQ